MNRTELRNLVHKSIFDKTETYTLVHRCEELEEKENQFLFFLKPELVCEVGEEETLRILDVIFDAFDAHHMEVESILVLPSEYLKDYGIMSEHYSVIDSTSRDAAQNLSQHARRKYIEVFGAEPGEILTLGGFDFLDTYTSFDAAGLNKIWASHDFIRLGGGTYGELHRIDGQEIVMINGFYPNMLLHYTRAGRKIVLFELRSDTAWKTARQDFVGGTLPASAKPGSIRHTLFQWRHELGIDEISPTYNGVHLSAGPVEGLVELQRFLSNRVSDSAQERPIDEFVLGKRLIQTFSQQEITSIIGNKIVEQGEDRISIFDFTEELDTREALMKLKEVATQFGR